MRKAFILLLAVVSFTNWGCDPAKSEDTSGKLLFHTVVDANQVRLDNFGNPVSIPAGNAAQTPSFDKIGVHYIELLPTGATQLGLGKVIYHADERTMPNGRKAIEFSRSKVTTPGVDFFSYSTKDIPASNYQYIRVSVSFQKGTVRYNIINIPTAWQVATGGPTLANQTGTLATFLGFNSYVDSYELTPNNRETVNDTLRQGNWAFESTVAGSRVFKKGYSPGTTVVNPLPNNPVPTGSCVVTGQFATPLSITGNEKSDRKVALSFSVNNSFEWEDTNGNGTWDLDMHNSTTPTSWTVERVVDMGLRGLIPSVQ